MRTVDACLLIVVLDLEGKNPEIPKGFLTAASHVLCIHFLGRLSVCPSVRGLQDTPFDLGT